MFDTDHLLLTAHGFLGPQAGLEEWSFGIRLRYTGATTGDVLNALVASMATPTATYYQTSCVAMSSLTHLKLAYILEDGHYPPGVSAYEHTYPAPLPGSNNSLGQPFQVAMAVSLTTAVSRGAAAKGRFYLPMVKYAVADDGRIAATGALAQANLTKVWLNALKGLAVVPAVFSQGTATNPAPINHAITGVRVGRVLDTIRSRRRNLAEDYQTVVL